ncbi:MAG: STAS domain-containing protein [Gammaproteobacteria bacterium]
MKTKQEKMNGFLVLSCLEERLDAHNSVEFKELIMDLIEKGEVNIIVHLGQVRFIDSSGLGALLSGFKNATSRSGTFSLSNIQPQVLSMFELTRLNRVFDIYSELEEAFDSVA